MQVTVGFSDHPDSLRAGRRAARQALETAGRTDKCDLVLLFCTVRHDQEILRTAVAQATGNTHCIYGGGAVGVITNTAFGYAGDQVGVACFWLDGSRVHLAHQGDLSAGEFEAGVRLGGKLGRAKPALEFLDEMLGVSITPEEYPFS